MTIYRLAWVVVPSGEIRVGVFVRYETLASEVGVETTLQHPDGSLRSFTTIAEATSALCNDGVLIELPYGWKP